MEAALRETLTFRSGPDGRNEHLWGGSGGGLQGRSPLSAAGKGSPRRLETAEAPTRRTEKLRCQRGATLQGNHYDLALEYSGYS